MAQITTGSIYRLRIITSFANQVGINVLHMRCESHTGTGGTEQELANAADLAWHLTYKSMMNNFATWHGVTAQKIIPEPPGNQWLATGNKGPGTGGLNALPKQTCGLISFKTPYAGPRYRGRMYLSFPAEEHNIDTSGQPSTTYVNTANGFASTLLAGLLTPDPINYSRLMPVLWHRNIGTATEVVEARSKARWATQRRRGDFGKMNLIPLP